jgi:hypothetical protein
MGEENVLLSDLVERYRLYHEDDDKDILIMPDILEHRGIVKRPRDSEDNVLKNKTSSFMTFTIVSMVHLNSFISHDRSILLCGSGSGPIMFSI